MRNMNTNSLIIGLATTAFVLAGCGQTDGGEVGITEATPTEESVVIEVVDGPTDQWDAPPEMTIDISSLLPSA